MAVDGYLNVVYESIVCGLFGVVFGEKTALEQVFVGNNKVPGKIR